MSVAMSVDRGTLMTAYFASRSREIQDTATAMLDLAESTNKTVMADGARAFGNPSLAPNVGRAKLGESSLGTHPPTAQGYNSLGDTASGMIPSMALGGYEETVSQTPCQD